MTVKILIVDDHARFREAVRSLLAHEPDLTVVAEADDGASAVRQAAQLIPNVVVMDVGLAGMSGIEATRLILAAHPQCVVLFLSMHSDRRLVDQALAAGAAGYVAKATAGRDLAGAIRTVAAGGTFLSPELNGSPLP